MVGEQLGEPQSLSGGTTAVVIGVLGALYGGLGVAQALQHTMNTAVERAAQRPTRSPSSRPAARAWCCWPGGRRGHRDDGAVHHRRGDAGRSVGRADPGLIASVLINAASVTFAFRLAEPPGSVRDVLPGALLAAVLWQLLQTFGVNFVSRVNGERQPNGVFALVLGLLAFLYLAAVFAVLCVEINVVRVDKLYPRALLTPFTDAVELTAGDRRATPARPRPSASRASSRARHLRRP